MTHVLDRSPHAMHGASGHPGRPTGTVNVGNRQLKVSNRDSGYTSCLRKRAAGNENTEVPQAVEAARLRASHLTMWPVACRYVPSAACAA